MEAEAAISRLLAEPPPPAGQKMALLEAALRWSGEGWRDHLSDDERCHKLLSFLLHMRFGMEYPQTPKVVAAASDLLHQVQAHVTFEALVCSISRVTKDTSRPEVRNHSYGFLLDWVKEKGAELFDDDKEGAGRFQLLLPCLVLGLTDVWSAIRKNCNQKFGAVLRLFTLTQVCGH
jgi:hypothetical protein